MFIAALERELSSTLTENNCKAVNTTTSRLIDLFSTAGALRIRDDDEIKRMFKAAYAEDKRLATKLVFYVRDICEGLGERRAGRIMLKTLAEIDPCVVSANLHFIPYYGRYDDLFVLLDTKVRDNVVMFIKKQLNDDYLNFIESKPVSLLAKWMPSENTSSIETRALARKLIALLKISPKNYRVMLSNLRKHLNIVETNLSRQTYDDINYKEVPSNAMLKYQRAFQTHDTERFEQYIYDVQDGKTTINAGVLYPYNIVEKFWYDCDSDDVLEAQWKALPNFVEANKNILIMADVSESMAGRPMATSIGLAIYFAERSFGTFANKYMTFTDRPRLITINQYQSLQDKIQQVQGTDVGYSTNFEAAFMAILHAAIKSNCSQKDLPEMIVAISDMEFDQVSMDKTTITHELKQRFINAGYKMPKLVFWNVNSRYSTFHAFKDDGNVILVSGQSTSVFKYLSSKDCNPHDFMRNILNGERYQQIVLF